MCQNILSLIQFFEKVFEHQKKYELLIEVCIRSLQAQYGSNLNVPDAVF